ncbi:MAG: FAD-dependent oxidoreductase, partial [Candidatus Hydrogenedentes bacterium]|nr:FAD-dependent oxidoreductase [Candidatus Hydrogenedentota bacterium]
MIWKRREFMQRLSALFGGAFAAGIPLRARAVGQAAPDSSELPHLEPAVMQARVQATDPDAIHQQFDLVVVGGGIAGASAAISAARNGVKVALVHERSMLGGNSSSEVRLYPENGAGHQPWSKESGIHDEFHVEERTRNHNEYREGKMNCHWDLVLYEWAIREPNLTLMLNTHMHRVHMRAKDRVAAVYCIQLGTEKTFMLEAPLFVDATGDGVLASRAGADFRWGREGRSEYNEPLAPPEADEKVMGNTLFFRAVDTGKPAPFKRPDWAAEFPNESDLVGRGHSNIDCGYWWIEVGTPYHPIQDNNAIVHEGLRQLLGVWDHIKNKGEHGAANYGLEFAGFWPYKRECRRILGDFVLTQQHVQDPGLQPDDLAYGLWGIDIHVQGGILTRGTEPYTPPGRDDNWETYGTMPYGIPLRALYSRNIDNLMMAGRPISGSYVAFASSRVLSTGSIVGQGVGVAAALCKKYNTTPRKIAKEYGTECQQILLRQDASIPGAVNEDPADLARQATVTASSTAALTFPTPTMEQEMRMPLSQIFPVSANKIDSVELLLNAARGRDTEVWLGLRRAAHVWDFRETKDLAEARAIVPKGESWVRFNFNVDVQPNCLYYVYTSVQQKVYWKMSGETETDLEQRCPVGVTPGSLPGARRWRPFTGGKSFCMRLTPESAPFMAQNVVR